ncbi:MAG: carbohydrate-binding domain-containing protein [Oscillospiraceae bacterium]|nr:carbohydrate-binding domain-containing protein [Oscillospiraceae bacterium]
MSTRKGIDFICIAVLILTLLLTVLFINGERFGIQVLVDEDAEGSAGSGWFTANDLNGGWDSASAAVITLKGDKASISGGGAYFYNGDVIISSAGRYVLRGALEGGSVVVDAERDSKVWLLLDGVEINCPDDACLRVDQADKVFLTLAEGSDNRMTSGEAYSDEALADNTDGVIFSHDDLTINGGGSLTLSALYRHGISANDDLIITGGRIRVSAVQDAIRANDALHICNADIAAEAGDDALVLNGAGGTLYIESGTFALSADDDGLRSAGDILLAGGSLQIRAGNDGVQSDGNIQLTDGSLSINAADDAIHAAGDILLAGGSLQIRAGDDGIHSDAAITVTGGEILIEDCYEGVEALTIDIRGGDLTVYPTDDGLNANGGSGGFGFGPGAETASSDTETWVHISGGTLTVANTTARDADGIDSNGDIVISGGVIRVSLPAGGTNSALDYGSESGGTCTVTGGEIVACGSYSMAEGFDESSTQCAILYNFSEGAEAGSTVSLETLDGQTLVSYTVPCSFDSVSISAPGLQLGESYRIVIGDSSEEITLSSTAASYGNAASSMFGGPMNWGSGMQRTGGRPGGHREERTDESGAPAAPPEKPDFGGGFPGAEMSPPPDMPDFGGSFPGDGEMGTPPDMPDFGGERPDAAAPSEETETEEQAEAEQTQFVPDASTWILLTLSLLALACGLLLAFRFEP